MTNEEIVVSKQFFVVAFVVASFVIILAYHYRQLIKDITKTAAVMFLAWIEEKF